MLRAEWIAQSCNNSLKLSLFYLVVQTNRLLDTDWLSPLMCNEIEMLFSIIRVVRMWCGILVSAAGFITNGGMFECSVAGIQNTTVYNKNTPIIRESMGKCTHGHSLL